MVRDVARSLQKNNAYLYGSYVYKNIIREYCESNFNEKPEINKIIPRYTRNVDETIKNYNKKYYNPTIYPEYKDRMIEIDSINCYMIDVDFKNLKEHLEKDGYDIKIKSSTTKDDETDLLNSSAKSTLSAFIIKFKSNYVLTNILKDFNYQIHVNIIHSKNNINFIAQEVFSRSNFECNTLALSPDNNYIIPYMAYEIDDPNEKLMKISTIIKDIRDKKTKIYQGSYNISKNIAKTIIEQNFNIYSDNFIIIDKNINELCIICHENFEKNNKHIKDINCNTHYCIKCYHDMINRSDFKEQCPVCKKDILTDPDEENVIAMMIELF
jgi:mRNA-degrading endonuclease HigB of HigAB toxin-antitoxin module